MAKYEAEIRKLAETPLGGPRFMSFIRRWEMNNEPPPKEEKIEKYAFSETHSDGYLILLLSGLIYVFLVKVEYPRLKRRTTSTRTMMMTTSFLHLLHHYSLEGRRLHHL
jgi:hypothetical protein